MAGKLDQSLDEIMKDRKPAGGRGRAGRLPNRKAATKARVTTATAVAPAGGIQKKTKAAKPVKVITPLVAASGDSKIQLSNLPEDVTEAQIKDYFSSIVAPVKRVLLNYGPNGRSRGSATVTFSKPSAAAEAVKYDGTKVDNRPMRIEVLMGAKSVPAPQPPKSLQDRVKPPKNAVQEQKKGKKDQPVKATANGAATAGKANKKKSGRAGRPKPKTAAELDAEMQDYFGGEAPATNGAAPATTAAAANGDTGMDEIM